jgi:SAM-dependent methyltransferase
MVSNRSAADRPHSPSEEVRPCPLCGSEDEHDVFAQAHIDPEGLGSFAYASRKLPELMHHRLVRCPGCDLVYASPAPSEPALQAAYTAAAYDSHEEAIYASKTYAGLLEPVLDRLPDRHGALDIGAGDGAFLGRLLELGFNGVVGVEPSRAPVAAAEPAVRDLLVPEPFDPSRFEAGSFALVTCFQTIEHVSAPLELVRAAYGLLKPGGAFLLVAHDRMAPLVRLLGRHSPIFDVEHLQLFSPPTAETLLGSAGFTRVEIRPVANRYPLHYWLKLAPLPARAKLPLLERLRGTRLGSLPVTLRAGNLAAMGWKQTDS